MQKPSYGNSLKRMTLETLNHPIRSLNLHKSIPAFFEGCFATLYALFIVLNALCSIVFRLTLLVAFPITFPLLAIIYNMNLKAEYEQEQQMLKDGKLSPEESAELGV